MKTLVIHSYVNQKKKKTGIPVLRGTDLHEGTYPHFLSHKRSTLQMVASASWKIVVMGIRFRSISEVRCCVQKMSDLC